MCEATVRLPSTFQQSVGQKMPQAKFMITFAITSLQCRWLALPGVFIVDGRR
jgi:hypothetical protein